MNAKAKRLLLLNFPYVLFGLLGTKLGQSWRYAPGSGFSEKFLHIVEGMALAFQSSLPSFAQKEYGPENIVSAVMHADELNTALTEQLGHPVYHYHMHVVALPVVDKEIRWTKRCKDPALVGTVKEVVHQISHSKKWASQKTTDGNGHAQIIKSYSLLQDRFFEHMRDVGFEDFERGERGSTAQHLSVMDFKVKKEESRLEKLENVRHELICDLDEIENREADARQKADAAEKRAAEIVPKVQKLEEVVQKYPFCFRFKICCACCRPWPWAAMGKEQVGSKP